jgi:hypothetical protein
MEKGETKTMPDKRIAAHQHNATFGCNQKAGTANGCEFAEASAPCFSGISVDSRPFAVKKMYAAGGNFQGLRRHGQKSNSAKRTQFETFISSLQ